MAAFFMFNGSNLALQANEHDEKSNLKAHLYEMKKKVADLRAKAADLKSHGKHQTAEEVIHASKELYQQFKKQLISSPRIRPHVCRSFSFSRSDARVAGVTGPA
jgi:hypothetical protein